MSDDRLQIIMDKVRRGGTAALSIDDITWMSLEIQELRRGREALYGGKGIAISSDEAVGLFRKSMGYGR